MKKLKKKLSSLFLDSSPIFPIESSSRVEPLDTSGLQPFAEILASFLDSSVPNSLVVNNLVPNVPFQQQPHNQIPLVMTKPNFSFPLPSLVTNANLKNIPPNALPKFYGLATKDPDTFFLEFDILYHNFDYNIDAHKLKLFSATLKELSL